MKFFERLFRGGQASAEEPAPKQETVVPDELVKQFPAPPEKLQAILQKVPNTGLLLYERDMECLHMSKEWKYWSLDMLENGFETPGIIQLAGEDLDIYPSCFDALIEDIFQELDLGLTEETIHYAYLLSVAQRVLLGEQTARSAFRLLCQAYVDNGFRRGPFDNFYLWDDIAVDLEHSSGDWESEGMRKDNLEEWMHQYFEKLVRANSSYCLSSSLVSSK